ncbi:S1C family serine protease [Streptomyces xiamenensis]|uniref:S1C family serine protease n=1 Tax=Streptomyces xiamenensis TaxID=408015 RepID=UPI003424397D
MSTEKEGLAQPEERPTPAPAAVTPEESPAAPATAPVPVPPAAPGQPPAPVAPPTAPIPTVTGAEAPPAPAGPPPGAFGGPVGPPVGPPAGPPDVPWTAFGGAPPPKKRRTGLIAAVIAATLLAGGVGGGVGYLVADGDSATTSSAASGAGTGEGTSARPPESVAGIAEAALPSVVTIEAQSSTEGGTGTGFVYDEQGHILTNNHVVASAADGGTLTVTFSDGASYDAEVVGRAEGYDVAVLRLLDAGDRDLVPLPVGDSDAVAVGDATIAIGAPFGLSGTVTTGIVSAKNRPVASSDGQGGSASYMSALQTDASINPGNSGGPLLNGDGEVIGVNSAIQSTPGSGMGQSQAGSIGLGFAIPINQAQRVAQDLIDNGQPVYAIIGASVETRGDTLGAKISDADAAGTDAVTPGGPAAEAGLQPGDVITRFGDRVIDSGPTLISEIWAYEPGDTVPVTYQRGGQEHTADIVLGERVGDA